MPPIHQRGSGRSRRAPSENPKNVHSQRLLNDSDESEFLAEMGEVVRSFQESGDDQMHLSPMNSFRRRIVHNLATESGLHTLSEGEGSERHIVLKKQAAAEKKSRSTKSSRSKTTEPPLTEESQPTTAGAKTLWDSGEREFLVPISRDGLEVVLEQSGYVGIMRDPSAALMDKKVVHLGSFKVKNGKIVTIEEANW